ncbi:fructose-bisphosphate aldolase [Gordonia amarae]|uniref:Glycosidase n=2 Tax=Gordonia amarae TaxID=36821 RepID=G7GQT7_9ACTN|nr:glycoside hydrolase family 76 protein [Gordonia amarae]MCS3877619.1 putative alpha-1,6-mannanase (GH76 family) [Gordonia amarae]QHN16333.1 fructose-bisphosphate aldolase [Gordonia amarae]QHN20902.1 fructose-bisphosphate aldolase [Gordonia amarae]QHN29753.1 fructose-bisphosphate aldolase [Gordonia amarae]QHN38528.1 fructose-bisphosphate aldolase [Gordonia amarae]
MEDAREIAHRAATSASATPNDRAAEAADAVAARHLRKLLRLPGTRIADVAWPKRRSGSWHYWWHAHFVDTLIDAAVHRPSGSGSGDRSYDPIVAGATGLLLRGIRLRNRGKWINNYYDDMAWLGLAVERADRKLEMSHPRALEALTGQMLAPWAPEAGGGIPWRNKKASNEQDPFFNAPANGPAAILLARTGHVERAAAMCDWIDATLVDPESKLIIDGVRPRPEGTTRVTAIYTYCQGVVLGAETELLRLTGDAVHAERIDRLLGAVERNLAPDKIIKAAPFGGGGDGGLFSGILARYLALIVTDLPAAAPGADELRRRAAAVVVASAEAAWANRLDVSGSPVFGHDWRVPARMPVTGAAAGKTVDGATQSSAMPEQDLSVQLSGWMVLEAAAAVDLGLSEHVSN